jgi:hypothetical protein
VHGNGEHAGERTEPEGVYEDQSEDQLRDGSGDLQESTADGALPAVRGQITGCGKTQYEGARGSE